MTRWRLGSSSALPVSPLPFATSFIDAPPSDRSRDARLPEPFPSLCKQPIAPPHRQPVGPEEPSDQLSMIAAPAPSRLFDPSLLFRLSKRSAFHFIHPAAPAADRFVASHPTIPWTCFRLGPHLLHKVQNLLNFQPP